MQQSKFKNTLLTFLLSFNLGAIASDQGQGSDDQNQFVEDQESQFSRDDEDVTRGCCDSKDICANNGTVCSLLVKGALSAKKISMGSFSVQGNASIGGNETIGGNLIVGGTITNASGGSIGSIGATGATGSTGGTGPAGPAGGSLAFASFYTLDATTGGDAPVNTPQGSGITFYHAGPASGSTITPVGSGPYIQFNLVAAGTYEVNWQLQSTATLQVVISILGIGEIAATRVGSAPNGELSGSAYITVAANAVMSLNVAAGSTSNYVPILNAGGVATSATATTITIKQIA